MAMAGPAKSIAPYLKTTRLHAWLLIFLLCFVSYLLGTWQKAPASISVAKPCASSSLDFNLRHAGDDGTSSSKDVGTYPPCGVKYSEHTPCEDPKRANRFDKRRLIFRERHCPARNETLKCRIPAPPGYRNPFPWPASRDMAWYANVPHKELTVEKAVQNWIQFEGDRFRFPGGGTMFPNGADAYIDDIGKLIDLRNGSIRTAIDTGCGVASWGAYLLPRDILAMSFAPRDTHEAQVQFALERGVPAQIGVLASKRLPYPSRAFDMAHCSRCLIPWGLFAKSLCWKKFAEKDDIAIWQKPINHLHCKVNTEVAHTPPLCPSKNPDKAWYTRMETCLTPLPKVTDDQEISGGELANWPERLNAVPPRIGKGMLPGITAEMFLKETALWERRVSYYKTVNNQLGLAGRYRNLLDMNAYLGGFAAALIQDPVWVMNVVPVEAKVNTLGAIYERGLIGTYHSWCEAMSTYPRTYDLIHADSLFSLYQDRCELDDILLEMDRVLRPEGSFILRDDVDVLVKVKRIIDAMNYDSQIVDHEDGALVREKLLFAVKSYWTASAPPHNPHTS
ncbi:hypothetical protein BT93_L0923 [Corymbia citriodora subsp. variegata]|uniref:Methyltransferase n=1 Tax=Corymbia citriodora subsp. variegata TaxID=360336 RepID=A0A8T0CXN5_CORYI|nr:hypothetical protein BT93_L0923 [Corymbia citriodora subsp. variegata]